MGKREEITDVISPEGYAKLKKGDLLNFASATLKVTAKRQGRIWAEHVTKPVDMEIGMTHYGHNVDTTTEDQIPFCEDCGVRIDQISTEEGERKVYERKTSREYRRTHKPVKTLGQEQREKRAAEAQEGEVVDGTKD